MAGVIDSLYHSGVGWLNDILNVDVFFDADLEAYSSIPHLVKDQLTGESRVEHNRPVFAGGAPVRGFVRITAPPGRSIPHSGVTARLESGLFALDDVNTRDLYSEERPIAGAGTITGSVDIPFEFPGTGKRPLGESFEGTLFSIRHQVGVTVGRPWYTFAVSSSAPFGVQRVHDIHRPYREEKSGGAPKSAAAAQAEMAALYGPQTLTLEPFDDGGKCEFGYDKGCYELGDHITGSIAFTGVTRDAPILLVKLAIVRIEYADEEVADTVVFDDAIMDARRWRARKLARLGVTAMGAGAHAQTTRAGGATASAAADDGEGSEDEGRDEDDDDDEEATPAPSKRGAASASSAEADAEAGTPSIVSPSKASASASSASASASAVLRAELSTWVPSESDLSDPEPDPDLPVLGDVTLNVDLDLGQLSAAGTLAPTQVMQEAELGVSAEEDDDLRAAAAEASNPDAPGRLREVSVRYFLRLTAYTGFEAEARRWNAAEIVLYRGKLHGRPIPPERAAAAGKLRSSAGTGGAKFAAASSVSGGASASMLPPPPSIPLPQPMTTPFAATLLFGRNNKGSSAAGSASAGGSGTPQTPGGSRGGAPLSPVVTPYFSAKPGSAYSGSARSAFPSNGAHSPLVLPQSAGSASAHHDFDAVESGQHSLHSPHGQGGGRGAGGDSDGTNLAGFLTKAVRISDVSA